MTKLSRSAYLFGNKAAQARRAKLRRLKRKGMLPTRQELFELARQAISSPSQTT